MNFLAATIYWVCVALWLTVLCGVIYYYARNPRAFGATRLLLTVIGIDTFRNILENTYFGFYFGARYGIFPAWVVDTLGVPELLILPKIANVIAGSVVLFLLLFRWLPRAIQEWTQSQQRTQDLETLAAIDPLTGLYNRRQFETLANAEFARAERYARPFSMLIIDIDHFKQINDRFGHQMGDWILKMVATSITGAKRGSDVIGRIGGEEFAILLPETPADTAHQLAERVREAVRSNALRIGNDKLFVTVSVGAAQATRDTTNLSALLHSADKAMYEAKRSGRDRTVVAALRQAA